MALVTKNWYQQTDDKESVEVFDGTLAGSASNTTGYGYLGNPNVADFGTCFLDIYEPDPTTLLPVSTITATINLYNTLPNINGASFTVTSLAVFGETREWKEGWYRMVVRQTLTADPSTEYTSDNYFPVIATTSCCIDQLILAYPLDDCDCEGDKLCSVLLPLELARMVLDQLEVCCGRETGDISNAEDCDFFNKGVKMMQYGQAVCAADGCEPCGVC